MEKLGQFTSPCPENSDARLLHFALAVRLTFKAMFDYIQALEEKRLDDPLNFENFLIENSKDKKNVAVKNRNTEVPRIKETTIIVSVDSGKDYNPAKTAMRIAEVVRDSKCECFISRGTKTVTAKSVLMLMALGIRNGDIVTIKCDDKNCVDKICEILQETK